MHGALHEFLFWRVKVHLNGFYYISFVLQSFHANALTIGHITTLGLFSIMHCSVHVHGNLIIKENVQQSCYYCILSPQL